MGDQPKDLNLDDDEGLGHYTSFFYDSSNGIILVQLNRNGITANGVAKYFKRNFKNDINKVQFNIVINPSEIRKLQQMSEIRNVTLSVARVQGGGILANDEVVRAVGELRGIADKTNADTISITLGMGYAPGSLRRNGIWTMFRNLLRADTHGDIKKLEVTGRETDEEALKVIDFITNKVVIEVTLPKARYFDVNSIDGIIRQAIDKYRIIKPEITSTYKVKNEPDE
ncbi:hypothetical protein MKQ70_16560 [Chitinophaga sedimenti]|uniref:DUF6731 family protein n=1 Tax=Chitinophaga sedimenti TaxID=2033606 RepID=UPI0020068A74|nr:DUF6731 family protein [Chitinophaga sedimenti]MCK7556541.1 hypothetical protein [Chitinophaga sedimenti]